MQTIGTRLPQPGSFLEALYIRCGFLPDPTTGVLPGAVRWQRDPTPPDPSGNPRDRTLCPACYRRVNPHCTTCGGERHRDGVVGYVCPDCRGARFEAQRLPDGTRGSIVNCHGCTTGMTDDRGYLQRHGGPDGLPRYLYSRSRELARIASWRRANPQLIVGSATEDVTAPDDEDWSDVPFD